MINICRYYFTEVVYVTRRKLVWSLRATIPGRAIASAALLHRKRKTLRHYVPYHTISWLAILKANTDYGMVKSWCGYDVVSRLMMRLMMVCWNTYAPLYSTLLVRYTVLYYAQMYVWATFSLTSAKINQAFVTLLCLYRIPEDYLRRVNIYVDRSHEILPAKLFCLILC